MTPIQQILLVGGTHGNELTGVRMVEQWHQLSNSIALDEISITPLIANLTAVKNRVRFVEEDLNRQFSEVALTSEPSTLEAKLAHQLNRKYGQTSNNPFDLVIDVHNTTSNMGATLILIERNEFNVQLARYVYNAMPECNILLEDDQSYAKHPYLCSIGKYGVMIEMGAQPQGVCRADVFAGSMQLLNCIAEFCTLWNQQKLTENESATAYQFIENIGFPLDQDNQVSAMVHPDVQDADFVAIENGCPIFEYFTGEVSYLQSDETIYPHFINEAAYQGTNVAFATARKIKL